MTNKYFKTPDGNFWQIVLTQDVWGVEVNYALEMHSGDVNRIDTGEYATNWEYIEDTNDIEIEHWFLWSDPTDLFGIPSEDEGNVDLNLKSSKLKVMLESLQKPISETRNTLGRAEDILGMIRDRHETIEWPHRVIINPKLHSDSASLEKAIDKLRQQHGINAEIYMSTTPMIPAEDFLATIKNKETLGITSYPDFTKGVDVNIDPETLELIKKLKPKK